MHILNFMAHARESRELLDVTAEVFVRHGEWGELIPVKEVRTRGFESMVIQVDDAAKDARITKLEGFVRKIAEMTDTDCDFDTFEVRQSARDLLAALKGAA